MRRSYLEEKKQKRRLGGGTGGADGDGEGIYEEGGGSGGRSESSISTAGRGSARELIRAIVKANGCVDGSNLVANNGERQ